jgi:hypothetical protein
VNAPPKANVPSLELALALARPPPGPPPRGLVLGSSAKSPKTKLKALAEKYKAGFPGGGGGAREGTLKQEEVDNLLQQATALGIKIAAPKNTNDKTKLNTQIRIVDAIIAHFNPANI